jgi:hypothetical protein
MRKTTKLNFKTHHPQGMMKVGGSMFMTSVEVTKKLKNIRQPTNLKIPPMTAIQDQAKAIFFQFDAEGNMIKDIPLGEGSIYHQVVLDSMGEYFWIPVAEYRPNSKSTSTNKNGWRYSNR